MFNELDNAVRAEVSVKGMKARVDSGRWQWRPPLGYLAGSKNGASLAIDPERAPLIQKLFNLVASGQGSKAEVLRTVTASGLRTAKGSTLSQETLRKLLRNRLYSGEMVVKGWNKSVRGDIKPLITEALFESVQQVLDGKSVATVPHLSAII